MSILLSDGSVINDLSELGESSVTDVIHALGIEYDALKALEYYCDPKEKWSKNTVEEFVHYGTFLDCLAQKYDINTETKQIPVTADTFYEMAAYGLTIHDAELYATYRSYIRTVSDALSLEEIDVLASDNDMTLSDAVDVCFFNKLDRVDVRQMDQLHFTFKEAPFYADFMDKSLFDYYKTADDLKDIAKEHKCSLSDVFDLAEKGIESYKTKVTCHNLVGFFDEFQTLKDVRRSRQLGMER